MHFAYLLDRQQAVLLDARQHLCQKVDKTQMVLQERRVDPSLEAEGECMHDGEVCLFRAGFFGGMMKMSCCPGTTCEMTGRQFVCVTRQNQGAQ